MCLPIIVGHVDFVEQAYPADAHLVSGRGIRETVSAMLTLSCMQLPLDWEPGSEAVAVLVKQVVAILGSAHRHQVFARAQLLHLDMQREKQWAGIKVIIAKNSVVGRGAHSIVYQGFMRPYPVPVAIKALDVRLAQAHSTRDFQASLEWSFRFVGGTLLRHSPLPAQGHLPEHNP